MKHEDITEFSDPHFMTLDEAGEHPAPEFRVVKGDPTDAELAAVVTVLAAAAGATPAPGPQELNRWGLPVDKLRYGYASWETVTLRDRTHIRR